MPAAHAHLGRGLLAAASAALLTTASPPLPVGAYTALGTAGYALANGTRFHNRPLYGPHNGLLVLAGDRPLVHVANDRSLFGGVLIGALPMGGGPGVWAHDADDITAVYTPGAFTWLVRDSRLPGVALSIAVLPLSAGFGAVVDVNVTLSLGAGATTVVTAVGCGAMPASSNALGWLYDPLINTGVLTWAFSPTDCAGNDVRLGGDGGSFNYSFASTVVHVALSTSPGTPASTSAVADASEWANITALAGGVVEGEGEGGEDVDVATRTPVAPPPSLPVPGAVLWLRASSLVPTTLNGSSVPRWHDESPSGTDVAQAAVGRQPLFLSDGLGPASPALLFDGVGSFLSHPSATIGNASTMFAIFRDEGSVGGDSPCCSGVLFYGGGSFNGISTLTPGGAGADDDDGNAAPGAPVVTKLDFAGSPANGHLNVRGRTVVAVSRYTPGGPSTWWVDGCQQGSASVGGTAGSGVQVGTRNDELGRFFKGRVGEVIVFPFALDAGDTAAMLAYVSSAWPDMPPKRVCVKPSPLAVVRTPLPPPPPAGAPTSWRLTWSVQAGSTSVDPAAALAAAAARVSSNTRVSCTTPDPVVDAALASMGPAVDGLWRSEPPVFVHGAMAWDVSLVGWRSEYGGTVLGRTDLVAAEGTYFFSRQVTESVNSSCFSDPAHMLTVEAPTSRFYGRGRVVGGDGMYDMQSQMFDAQVHMWRWTGNATHEALLRPALAMHAEWAGDTMDADGNGLYASYINTWPTDSVWYNGGESPEETAYMLRTHEALRDMAVRAGNESDAAAHEAVVATIRAAFPTLWVTSEGHPAAFREEGGHRRLRPDAWAYSVFVPIEAGLLTGEAAASALFYTEWGLQRDAMPDPHPPSSPTSPPVVMWTSNWVPSQWSVRQLWSGDNYALAQAYFTTGLPDSGYAVLRGNLVRDALVSGVPGQAGGANGGTDFNDCVHPLSRSVVEGLFGYHPDYILGVVTVSPQLPSTWEAASLSSVDVRLVYTSTPAPPGGEGLATLSVTLTQPAPVLVIRLPLRGAAIGGGSPTVSGLPVGAVWNHTTEVGFGQAVVVVSVYGGGGGATVQGASVALATAGGIPYTPSVLVGNLTAGQGAELRLPATSPLRLLSFSDPQGAFLPGTANISADGSAIVGVLSLAAGAGRGAALVFGYASAPGGLTQATLFKLNVSAPAALPPPTPSPTATWAFAAVEPEYNADLRAIFSKGTYLSPRPETCGVRLGSDGWSAWTFTYWNGPAPPTPDFSNVPNLTIAQGVIATPQGARFALNATAGARNVAFASLWDNFPASVTVSLPPSLLPAATAVWALVAGSTNPMQTLLANAVLRVRYADGSADELPLVPPMNYWALSPWGDADYSYATDAFCLPPVPPPSVALGGANRAMVYAQSLRAPPHVLVGVELEALSQEVVVGLLAVSLMAA